MDIQQIKLLAARIRALLQQANCPIGHNQSLDIAAALPGLRNWPEVQAFADRLVATQLDAPALSRLAFRLKRKFNLDFTREELHAALDPKASPDLPQIWPTGPAPGVYLTTEQAAIDALLGRFEEASDGALVYAERAGNHWNGSINLGEDGLWSSGLQRVPSGTLIIVGPIDFEQSSWDDSAQRLQMACFKAFLDGHRVAVLINTPTPERLCEDSHLMVRTLPDSEGVEEALRGLVSDDGELIERKPFVRPSLHTALTTPRRHAAKADAIPAHARKAMQTRLAAHRSGLVLVGSGEIREQASIALSEAALALSDHCGPAARIMPRTRSTPAKYWQVPDAIKDLPFLPSIQSAYDQGFRRMVVYGNYTDGDVLLEHPDVLFICGAWGCHVTEVFMSAARTRRREEVDVLEHVLAILAVAPLSADSADLIVSDLYLKAEGLPSPTAKFEEVMNFIESNRTIRWEDEFERIIEHFNAEQVLLALRHDNFVPRMLDRLLDQLKQKTRSTESYLVESSGRKENDTEEARKKILKLIKKVRATRSEQGEPHG